MRLDLKELIAKVTGQAEFKKLLWTNPNTQSAFSAQYVHLDLSNYDAVEIEVNMYTSSTGEYHQTFYGRVGTNLLMSGLIYQTTMPLSRLCEIRNASILFNDGFANTPNNQAVIPVRIYGIKYVGGGYCLTVFSRLSAIFGLGGGVDEGRYKGIDSETDHREPSRQEVDYFECDRNHRCTGQLLSIKWGKSTEWCKNTGGQSDINTSRWVDNRHGADYRLSVLHRSIQPLCDIADRLIRGICVLHFLTISERGWAA